MNDGRRIVRQLDHLVVSVDDPRPLFELLTEKLQLPVAWPMRSYPSFTSGGVTLGNLYLEIISCAPQRDSSGGNSTAARFAAIAFETASLMESVRELDGRRIPHGPVTPYEQIEADGSRTRLYANVILGKMLGRGFWIDAMIFMGRLPGASAVANPGKGGPLVRWGIGKVMSGNLVFLVEYSYANFADLPHWSEFKNHEEKRAADRAALGARRGGALGVESAEEIVAGLKDVKDANGRWRRLLGAAAESAAGVWEIADGPRVRLVSSGENAIQALVLKVASLTRAAAFLAEAEMLAPGGNGQVRVAPERLHGLEVRLVE